MFPTESKAVFTQFNKLDDFKEHEDLFQEFERRVTLNRPVFFGQWVECIHAAAPVPRRS